MNILNLFNDGEATINTDNYPYYKNIQEFKDNNPQSNIAMDPINQAKAIANIHSHKEEENRRNRENWNNTEKHKINLILNGKAGSSSLSNKMKSITEKTSKQIQDEYNDINRMKDLALDLVTTAKDLYICNKDEKKAKRKELYVKIENAKQKIKIFKKNFDL